MLFNLEENASAQWLVCFTSLSSYHAKRKKFFFLRFFDQTLLMMMESSVTVASPQGECRLSHKSHFFWKSWFPQIVTYTGKLTMFQFSLKFYLLPDEWVFHYWNTHLWWIYQCLRSKPVWGCCSLYSIL